MAGNLYADALHVLPPCGRYREIIRQIDPAKLDTEVVPTEVI